LLRSDDQYLRCVAADALGRISGEGEVVERALRALVNTVQTDRSIYVRGAAYTSLGILCQNLRVTGENVLKLFGRNSDQTAILSSISIGKSTKREVAAFIASFHDENEELTIALKRATGDRNAIVRCNALYALSKFWGSEKPELAAIAIGKIRDENVFVSVRAMELLTCYGQCNDVALKEMIMAMGGVGIGDKLKSIFIESVRPWQMWYFLRDKRRIAATRYVETCEMADNVRGLISAQLLAARTNKLHLSSFLGIIMIASTKLGMGEAVRTFMEDPILVADGYHLDSDQYIESDWARGAMDNVVASNFTRRLVDLTRTVPVMEVLDCFKDMLQGANRHVALSMLLAMGKSIQPDLRQEIVHLLRDDVDIVQKSAWKNYVLMQKVGEEWRNSGPLASQ